MNEKCLAVIGEYTLEPLKPLLETALSSYGLTYDIRLFGYGRDHPIWAGVDPEFSSGRIQGAIVIPNAQNLFRRWVLEPRTDGQPSEEGKSAAMFLVSCIDQATAHYGPLDWVITTAEPIYPGLADCVADVREDPLTEAIEAFNATVIKAAQGRPGWSIFDRSRVTSLHGAKALYDPRLALLARFPGSAYGMQVLAERLGAHWAAVQGRMRKVLALDCDNTLWGGVVGEDGIHGIQIGTDGIGAAYLAFQQAVLALESRGVILTLCTRNNPEDVEAVFATRPEMAIPRDRIAAVSIGWGRKSDGLRALADSLGLGVDSFVFVDDNIAEREEVRAALPQVAVPEFPQDPADLAAFAYELGWRYFYRIVVSDEDKRRTEQYRARAQFQSLMQRETPSADFLKSLDMKVRVALNSKNLISRAAQLTQKTNQFNLTLRRYTEGDLTKLLENPDVLVCLGHLRDRFGDHGWVGLAILRKDPQAACWWLDVLLASCRVLGRDFERIFTAACLQKARDTFLAPIYAEYIPGPRNGQASCFLDKLGMQLLAHVENGRRTYLLATDQPIIFDACIMSIEWE